MSDNSSVRWGIYGGSSCSGEMWCFIPDPDLEPAGQTRISGTSGITSSHDDLVIYAADVVLR